MNINKELDRLHQDLGWKPLSRIWAKLEVVLGLLAFVCGLPMVQMGDAQTPMVAAGAVLSVLGGYLTLAGHRSHLYQSNTRLAAWVVSRCAQQLYFQQAGLREPDATDRSNLSGPDLHC